MSVLISVARPVALLVLIRVTIPMRIRIELFNAGLGAKVECLPRMVACGKGRFRIHIHAANRVFNCICHRISPATDYLF